MRRLSLWHIPEYLTSLELAAPAPLSRSVESGPALRITVRASFLRKFVSFFAFIDQRTGGDAMTTTVRIFLRAVPAVLLFVQGFGIARAQTVGEQTEQFTPEFRQVHTNYDVKHTPKIVAPDTVARGEWFTVTVSVGAGSQHPSLSEHFVRYIALYKDTVEIARVYLHPVYSSPTVTFTVALDEGGSLRALAEPTHSAAWEVSKKIVVRP
jgi:superoxide reductase